MSQPLGRVTTDLEVERGADAEARISIPARWLQEGATLEIDFASPLVCAACRGGGCDVCERSGAVRVGDAGAGMQRVRVTLPRRDPGLGEIALRLPHQGGLSSHPGRPPGHLLLVVRATPDVDGEQSLHVRRIATFSQESGRLDPERRQLMIRSLVVAAFLVLTFVGLLRLSGWL